MKQTIVWLLLLSMGLQANSQGVSIIADDTPVGLGIMIEDNQELTKPNIFNAIISSPAIIKREKNQKGELYIKLYINSDVDVIVTRVSKKDRHLYKVIQKISLYYDDNKLMTSPPFTEHLDTVPPEEDQPAHLIIHTSPATERCIQEYSVIKSASGKVVSTLKLDYTFPKPEPEILTIEKRIITQSEDRPSDNTYYDTAGTYEIFKAGITKKNLVTTNFDPVTHLPTRLVLPIDANSLLIRFKRLYRYGDSDNYLEYKFSMDSSWKTTVKKANPFIILRSLPVGKYKLQVRYPQQADGLWEYEFEIKPVWTQTTSFKVFTGSFLTAFFCFILFLINNRRQKRKLKAEIIKREQLQTQITSLRSQLHPHFIFNALSSIQGLVNTNNIDKANLYMSKFGSLLHEILEKGDKTMHPLANEIRQIEYYLQLEQLRFNFTYKIEVGEMVNTSEIDIPILLLQPYIENAIKHGIYEKKEAGVIEVNFERQATNLMIQVKDNGKGYDLSTKEGYGNTLIKERVSALNKLFKGQQIVIETSSIAANGTCVTLIFHNWP